MEFPVWDPGFAHGLLIAVVAILHVFVSHFAVGGGLFLVVTELRARRTNDSELLSYVRRHTRFFILLTLVFGAISGVGIWFTIGLINPSGTSALIRAFVWGWAIEWVFFFVEIAAAMIYYYGWDRLNARTHLAVGWIYFGAAWLSMVVINGILTFQLTPGAWIETHAFWDGFLNPTYLPSLLTRTAFAFSLAGLFAVVTGSRATNPAFKSRLLRYASGWVALPLAATIALAFWWWGALPDTITTMVQGQMPVATRIFGWLPLLALVPLVLTLLGPLALPRLVSLPYALVLLITALGVMGAGEWLREAVRKPFVVCDYMYVNGIRVEDADQVAESGYLAHAKWAPKETVTNQEELGEEVFRAACLSCHARDGYNGLRARTAGWDSDFARAVVTQLEYIRGPMPPWFGTEEEADAVAAYLLSLNPSTAARPAPTDPLEHGRAVFEQRCGLCHTVGAYRNILDFVEGLSADEIVEFLPDLESDYMPPFTGTDEEAAALAGYLVAEGGSTP